MLKPDPLFRAINDWQAAMRATTGKSPPSVAYRGKTITVGGQTTDLAGLVEMTRKLREAL